MLFSTLIIFTATTDRHSQRIQETDLTEMSIEDLMNVDIKSTATLTDTKPRLVPAAVTTVTDEQIKASGARSLFELLDIYVPNLQWKYDILGTQTNLGCAELSMTGTINTCCWLTDAI